MCKSSLLSFFGMLFMLGGIAVLNAPAVEAAGKLPRFVSLRADKVNVRVGPGVRYPINWVYVRKGLPVEVLAEFELWRKVRDRDGVEGWVHKSLLSGGRSAIVTGGIQTLYRQAGGTIPVLRVETGVQGQLRACTKSHCRLRIAGSDGWIDRRRIWGVYPNEIFD